MSETRTILFTVKVRDAIEQRLSFIETERKRHGIYYNLFPVVIVRSETSEFSLIEECVPQTVQNKFTFYEHFSRVSLFRT